MGRIQSDVGLITGTKISSTVEQLLKFSARPRDRLQARVDAIRKEQVTVTELTALVIGVQLQSKRLGGTSNLSGLTAKSSSETVLAARPTSGGTPGVYQIQTVQTAQTSSHVSGVFSTAAATLSSGSISVRTGGFVDRSLPLEQLNGGSGVERGLIRITNRAGVSRQVDLRFSRDLKEVAATINAVDGLQVRADVEGDRLRLQDITGSTASNLIVAEVEDGRTAADLGLSNVNVASDRFVGSDLAYLGSASQLANLRDGRGLEFSPGNEMSVALADGTSVDVDLSFTEPPSTVGALLEAIVEAGNGKISAAISPDGDGIRIVDLTSGASSTVVSGSLADQLGLSGKSAVSGTVSSERLQSAATGTLLGTLRGGKGLGQLGTIAITNRAGTTTSVDLSSAESLDDVVAAVNASATGVIAKLNRGSTGISIQDASGGLGNLSIVSGDSTGSAEKLSIAANAAAASVDGGSLDAQFVTRSTKMGDLNQGRGVRGGTITIADAAGKSATLTVGSNPEQSLGQLIDRVNALEIDVEARLNDAGDGFYLIDRSGGGGTLTVTEAVGGSTAKDLGITGAVQTKVIDGQSVAVIEAKQNFELKVAAGESIEAVVERLGKDAGSPVSASLLRIGGGSVRAMFSSKAGGLSGRVDVDGSAVGLTVSTAARPRDAVIAVGASDIRGGTLLNSSSNVFDDAIEGLSLEVKSADDQPVTVTVERSFGKAESALKLFVDQYNKVVKKLKEQTKYDPITGAVGDLFGSVEALRVEQGLNRFVNTRGPFGSSIRSLASLGVDIGEDGQLSLNAPKLNAAIAENPEAVEKFLTDETTGLAARGNQIFENLIGIDNSLLVSRNSTLQRQIESATNRIAAMNERLVKEEQRLYKQFIGMEEAIAKMQANLGALDFSAFNFSKD